jgi:pimeloyl-ACP methyl ester carboxylesterase
MTASATPVVFIHGLWLHATSWNSWVELFGRSGYAPVAPGWPGDLPTVAESRANPNSVAGYGIEDVTAHFRDVIDGLDSRPILIGHSFGGMIAEKLLGENYGIAAVAIDAAQIKGVLPLPLSALHSTWPVFKNPANKGKAVTLTPQQFRYSFANGVTEEESRLLYDKWTIPAPGRPLFEAAAANFSLHSPAKVNTDNAERGPLLLIMGGQDHTVPEAVTKSTLKQYKHSTAVTDLIGFEDRGHSLTIDNGWSEVAKAALSWLDEQRSFQ